MTDKENSPEVSKPTHHFIHQIIDGHNESGRFGGKVHTRFPPEPNGYLHIGHAKSICLNFGIAQQYDGKCNLRFDDTNPTKENIEYVESIKRDIQWLGFDWEDRLFHASDYFQQLYDYAVRLIKMDKAYIDELSAEEFAKGYKGTPTSPGKNSPYRDRPIEESLDLFERMKNGEFEEGRYLLRGKIDMSSPNMHMRDPAFYRIKHHAHYRTGEAWHIYPMYDFAHGLSDSIEGITHSLCTLEFEVHRPLYEWINETLGVYEPQQIEFARLELNYTITSKRKLLQLVEEGHVDGWDDPRMPTLAGLRRRGYTPASIRNMCERVGVARRNNIVDLSLLEFSVREDLNKIAPRRFGVLRPLKLVITNYPEGETEWVDAVNNPEDPDAGSRKMPFGRELYIDESDFMEDPPRKFFRLGPDRTVRLKFGYIVKCTGVDKTEDGSVSTVYCEYYPESKSGQDTSGIKVKGTLSWVSIPHAVPAEIRLYDRLFNVEAPAKVEEGESFLKNLNPDSLEILDKAVVEPAVRELEPGQSFQFERQGYFVADSRYSTDEKLVLNRTVTLRDDWAKQQNK